MTPAAAADLQGISDYLKEHHPQYRDPTTHRLYGDIRALKQWPGRGRPGREEGTREILFPPTPYVAVYRVREETIEVMRIYHVAQSRP
ncbi:MAG TPA: type II toxin-antitoxin system RelE/ParE family toxin [Bryobacteraceae bacterium]|nr:type II toxin-antitoxin system RelE/ParE family toxin [Bryobacteraceae bacterium]